jgi:hypothetical protein
MRMKKLTILFFATLTLGYAYTQSIGIGTSSPAASAQLDITSTTKGLLAPRMTTAQRNAIPGPAKGLLVYDTDLNALYHYNGAAWAAVGGGGGGFSLPYEATVNLNTPAFKITNSGLGAAIHAVTTNEFGYALQATNTTNYGYSVYGYARSPNAIGVYALGDSSIAVKAESGKGIGLDAISTDSTALRARIIKGANTDPVILASHAGVGIAVDASSNTGTALRGTSNTTGSSITGMNNHGTSGTGVYGGAVGTTGIGVFGGAGGTSGIGVRGEAQSGTGVLGYSNNGTGVSAGTIGGTALYGNSISGYGLESIGKIKISGGNTNPSEGAVLTSVDASGNAVWKTRKVGFSVTGINTNLLNIPKSTNTTIHLPTKEYDYGNNYSAYSGSTPSFGNSIFVAPVTGLYHFDASLSLDGTGSTDYLAKFPELRLVVIRGGRLILAAKEFSPLVRDGFDQYIVKAELSKDVRLLSGDIVFLEAYHLSDGTLRIWKYRPDPFFSGHLVFAE